MWPFFVHLFVRTTILLPVPQEVQEVPDGAELDILYSKMEVSGGWGGGDYYAHIICDPFSS